MTIPSPFLDGLEFAELTGIFEYCPEMLAILTDAGEFRRANVASARIIGHPGAELTGKSFFDLIHPDDVQFVSKQFARAIDSAERLSLKTRCRASDGSYRSIQWSLYRPKSGSQIFAVAQGVKDNSAVEKELARANQLLGAILLSAPLPIWASDPEGRIQFWNQAAERILGWTSEEVLRGAPPDMLPKCTQDYVTHRLSGEKRTWRRKDGSTRDFRFWTALLHENGAGCGTLGMAVDVTEHDAEVYEALQQAYKDLRHTREAVMEHERLRVLGQMASGITHDLNNALAPVKLYAQVLLEDEKGLSERGRANLKTIRNAVNDVTETVARLREFYRARELELTLLPFDLNELVHQVVDLTRARWRDMAQQNGVTINVVTELTDDLPSAVGIESEIREALINLIFNAVDAMPRGGVVTLRSGVTPPEPTLQDEYPRQAYLEIADTGIGMDENTRRRCLEPFFTTKGERGTGLGLAMVYGILKRNDAEIEIESAVGQGTTAETGAAVPLTE